MPNKTKGKPLKILLIDFSRKVDNCYKYYSLAIEGLKKYLSSLYGKKISIDTISCLIGDSEKVFTKIEKDRPDIIGFSCYLWNAEFTAEVCRSIKNQFPEIKLILGGPEATGRKLPFLKKANADYLIVGEGELPLSVIAQAMLEGKKKLSRRDLPEKLRPGIVFSEDCDDEAEKTLSSIIPLDGIPTPFCGKNPAKAGFVPRMFFPYETMRGCPNRCTYCMWTELGRKSVRYFPLQKVKEDFDWIVKNSPQSFIFIADSDTFANRERAVALAPVFHNAAKKGNLKFVFQTNLKSWDKELMSMYNNESFELNIGVNSLNDETQKFFGRRYSREFVEEKLIELHNYAPDTKVLIQFMYGCPKEKFSDFCFQFDWAWNIPYFYKMFFHTQVLPGTMLYKRAGELGIKCRPVPPFYTVATAECSEAAIKTEELMILCVAIWMAMPTTAAYLRKITAEKYSGSFSLAFLSIWKKLPESGRLKILDFHACLSTGQERLLDEFQLHIMNDISILMPDRESSSNSTVGDKLSRYSKYVSSLLIKYA